MKEAVLALHMRVFCQPMTQGGVSVAEGRACLYIYICRSHCHGNVSPNDDSKSQKSIPIALHVILNPIHVQCGQSTCEVHMTLYLLYHALSTVNIFLPYGLPKKVGLRADSEGV